ncbi:EpsG family protein [Aerococcus urinaeequi]|uniref:EpsG family protein n=1 Tax=Aerococcus urinaeequi TaxID=51665 RepID=UPI003AB0D320
MLNPLKNTPLTLENLLTVGPYKETVLTNLYFYIMSKSENLGWFAALPPFMIFGILTFVCLKFIKEYKVSFRSISLFLVSIISVSSLLGILTGIRQNSAWAVLMLAFYYDFFSKDKKKVNSILLYLTSILIHSSAIGIVSLRILLIIIKKFPWAKYLLLLWPLSLVSLTIFESFLPSILQNAAQTLEYHYSRDYIVTAKFLVGGLAYVLILFLILKLKNKVGTEELFPREYYEFFLLLNLFGISSYMVPTLFERTIEFVMYMSLPFIHVLLRSKFVFRRTIILILVVMFMALFYWQDLMLGYFF